VCIPPENRLFVIPLCILGTILIKNLLLYGNTVFFSWLNWRISHRLRFKIFQQLLKVNYSFLESQQSGKFVSVLNNETWQTAQALAALISLIISVCTISVFVTLLVLISWQLTLLVGLFVLVISSTIQAVTRKVKHLGEQAAQANAVFVNRAMEGLAGMRVIRAFGRESYELKYFEQASDQVCNYFTKLDKISGSVYPLSEVLYTAALTFILVVAVQDKSNLPTLLTFIFMLYRLQSPLRQLDSARVNIIALSGSVKEVMALLKCADQAYIRSGDIQFTGLKKGIFFEGVTFRYHESEPPALKNISLEIPQGKTTAIVGYSGAGKSTLIDLICRFYEVMEGEIYIDGYRLRDLDLASWRQGIAIVSQDLYIFNTTLRENIAYGRLDATEEEIIAAAKLANAHEFISKLPLGYDTKVGDRGIRLSGGQRQRIALTRAIIRNPEILILDEATNALDSISENLIQESLRTLSQSRTVIVIAHRLSTIEDADKIIVMNEGRVVEQGNLQELLKLNGLFAQLYRLQYRERSGFSGLTD
jgi:ABC-type multidrug transport system fused ATPase/permease subunit